MKKLLSMLLILVLALSMVACGEEESGTTEAATSTGASTETTEPEEEALHVGFVVKSLADQHWTIVKAGAEAKAAELGVELTFIAPNAESDVQSQVTMLENLVGQEVSAICVAPSSPDAVIPVFEKATEAGIPILAIDTDTAYEEKASFIGTGNESAAKLGGVYACEAVGAGGTVIILRGRLGDKTHDDREAGLVAACEEVGMEILEIKSADSEAEKGMNVMQDLINVYDKIDLVMTTSDSMAQGAQRAIEAAGVETQVMGFDGTVPVAEMTAEGLFIGTTAQSPYNMGAMGVEYAVKVAQGEEIPDRIDTGAEVVTPENASEFLDKINALVN